MKYLQKITQQLQTIIINQQNNGISHFISEQTCNLLNTKSKVPVLYDLILLVHTAAMTT